MVDFQPPATFGTKHDQDRTAANSIQALARDVLSLVRSSVVQRQVVCSRTEGLKPRKSNSGGQRILRLHKCSKGRRGDQGLRDVSMSIGPGDDNEQKCGTSLATVSPILRMHEARTSWLKAVMDAVEGYECWCR